MKFVLVTLITLISCSVNSFKICFHENNAGERGTAVSMFDFALYSEKLLGYESHIILPLKMQDTVSLMKFKNRFNVTLYDDLGQGQGGIGGPELPKHAISQGCKLLYIQKGGFKYYEPIYPSSFMNDMPTAVHAVFDWDPHGTTYAAISPAVHPTHDNNFVVPLMVTTHDNNFVVPYMVTTSNISSTDTIGSLRSELDIPLSATTVCRHGGSTTFSIDFAKNAVKRLIGLFSETELHFIFLNTDNFIDDKKVHYLKKTSDMRKKEEFFSACDCMLHARADGETFGLAVGEFSIRGKPVLTTDVKGRPAAHIEILGDKGFYYKSEDDIISIISGFIKNGIPKKDYNAYREYSPEKVMVKFKKLFVDPIFPN